MSKFDKFNEEVLENVTGGVETDDDEAIKRLFAWLEKNKEKIKEDMRKIREYSEHF